MDGNQDTERQDILNQIRLDLLLRRLGTTVLRRKFKEIYAKLNDVKQWTDGPEAGEKLCRRNWGNGAYVNAQRKQQEMMKGGDVQNWDLHCLQSVITQMLTAARKNQRESNNSRSCKKSSSEPKPIKWDKKWEAQMSKIRQLTNIRNSIAHMPNGALTQGEFDEKWGEAVVALKALGAKQEEIDEILQVSQSAFSLPGPTQQGQMSTKNQWSKKEVQSQLSDDNPENLNKENELRADCLTKSGVRAGRSGDWDKALEFYTRALEVSDISVEQRKQIYMNRSWIHFRILQMPDPAFNFHIFKSGGPEPGRINKSKEKLPSQSTKSEIKYKFVDEKFLEADHQNWPQKLSEELKEFHLTAGMADAESALQLSPGQSSPKAYYRLAQFHQLKGDWKSALTYFDLALDKSDLADDFQLEFDRNVCQLELLNENEVEEFHWIPGKKNQILAGLEVRRNPEKWRNLIDKALNDPRPKLQFVADVLKAHFLAQGLHWEDEGQNLKELEVYQTTFDFEQAVKLYERAANGGLPLGFYNLGLLLQKGQGVLQPDFFGAVRLFKIAAQFPVNENIKTPDWMMKGIVEAQYRLGLCYEFGLGVGKDDKKALHWYEMASLGDYGRASRRLGDIYSQGLLSVAKDIDMAIFCWETASDQGDALALMSATQHLLPIYRRPVDIMDRLNNITVAIRHNSLDCTPRMLTAMMDRKQQFQSVLANVLQGLSETTNSSQEGELESGLEKYDENEWEPEGVSWNVPAMVEHTLHTVHLLELVQDPKFRKKVVANPNWRRLNFTNRLLEASDSCIKGLAAFDELNKFYRGVTIKGLEQGMSADAGYPVDIRMIPGFSPDEMEYILAKEAKLVAVILKSFANSISLVGAASLRDRPTLELILYIVKTHETIPLDWQAVEPENLTSQEIENHDNAVLILAYMFAINGQDRRQSVEILTRSTANWKGTSLVKPFLIIFRAASEGWLGKFQEVATEMEKFFTTLDDIDSEYVFGIDLCFVQALCCKSAALSKGVSSVDDRKIEEAMTIFQEFLSISPKDEPRRAEAHYQLGLCTLYLEKMKVMGQVKSLTAEDILGKVMLHFTQGEVAEQNLPWKDFPLPPESSVKLFLHRKIKELEVLVNKSPNQISLLASVGKTEKPCFGKLVDNCFKFPASSFYLKLKGSRRIEVITKFRKLFKAAHSEAFVGSSSSIMEEDKLADLLLNLPDSPWSGRHLVVPSYILGYYEIVEPVLYCRVPGQEDPEMDKIGAFTVVQDESGSVFYLKLTTKHQRELDEIEKVGTFQMGDRIIINRPSIRLHEDGGSSLTVEDTDEQVFHLHIPSKTQQLHQENGRQMTRTRKCGFCGEIGGTLQHCSKCKTIYYCGKECQTADWKELKHNWICPYLRPRISFPLPGI